MPEGTTGTPEGTTVTSEGTTGTATLKTVGGLSTLRFERRLAHSPEKVWRALTDPAELTHWFPQDLAGTFGPGEKLSFVFRGEPPVLNGEVLREFSGEVLEFDPPRVLAYTWAGDTLRFTLAPDGAGCLLVFTDTFAEHGKAARDGAGWHVCLQALHARLDGAAAPAGNRWKEHYDRYAEAFGPGAASAPLPG
jgi:uncharacterized protein YndB with AHSA1/START domain